MNSKARRGYDESKSPQWKYLLQKESKQRRKAQRTRDIAEKVFSAHLSEEKEQPNKRSRREKQEERKTKTGKRIVYSASPGDGENWRSPSAPPMKKDLDIDLKKFRN